MKNILIITIGNSDVQITNRFVEHGFKLDNPDSKSKILKRDDIEDLLIYKNRHHDNYLISEPRIYAEKLDANFLAFRPILAFPIILPVIEKLKAEGIILTEIWLVYTNQAVEVESGYRNNDTLFFKNLIEKEIKARFPEIETKGYEISEQVSNIDFQYADFFKKGKQIIEEQDEIGKIYLLAQGGIDQVNIALTLQFIQLFKEKLILYQKAENDDAHEMNFPKRFLHDLNKGKIIEHLNNYNFRFALELLTGTEGKFKIIKKLCKYAADRLDLLHEKSIFCFNDRIKEEEDFLGKEFLEKLKSEYRNSSVSAQHAYKLSDLIYQCKICFIIQGDFNKGLMLFFNLIENLIKVEIEKKFSHNYDLNKYRKANSNLSPSATWKNFIQTIDKHLYKYLQNIRMKNGKSLDLVTPNRNTYWFIFSYLLSNDLIFSEIKIKDFNVFFEFSENISGKRNEVAHNLGGASEAELDRLLSRFNFNRKTMFNPVDQIAGTSGFGIFEEVQKEIFRLLDE